MIFLCHQRNQRKFYCDTDERNHPWNSRNGLTGSCSLLFPKYNNLNHNIIYFSAPAFAAVIYLTESESYKHYEYLVTVREPRTSMLLTDKLLSSSVVQ